MRLLLFVICFFMSLTSTAQTLREVQNLYFNSPTEEGFKKIVAVNTSGFSEEQQNIYLAYKGSATMALAQYAFLPNTKFSLFSEGKELMEKSIEKSPSVENIYLRLITQLSAPSFLGYNEHIEDDIQFLEKHFKNAPLPEFVKKGMIKSLHTYNEGRYDLSNLTL